MNTYIVEVYREIEAPLESVQESDIYEDCISNDVIIQNGFKEETNGHWESSAAHYVEVKADDEESAKEIAMETIDFDSLDKVINAETVWTVGDGDWIFWEATKI